MSNTCLYANDIDDYACAVYEKNWNDGTMHREDIKNVTTADVCRRGIPDIIAAGIPCQDVSLAGRGDGLREGNRTGLWFEMLRLVSEIRPKYAVVENVPGLVNRGLDIILGTLSEIGYDAEWEIISASAFGAPHQRDRIFIVAYPRCELWESGQQEQRSVFGLREERDPHSELDRSSETRVATDSQSEYRRNMLEESKERETQEQSRGLDRSEAFREWGVDIIGWEVEPCVDRVVNGIPDQVDRLKCLGNAIVPQVAEYVGRCIMQHNGGEFTFAELFAGIGGFRLGFEGLV